MQEDTTPAPESSPRPELFVLNFGDGVRCAAQIDWAVISSLPAAMIPGAVEFVWKGKRTARHWSPYCAWVQALWQCVVDTTGKRLLCVMAPPNGKPLAVAYVPGLPPEMFLL